MVSSNFDGSENPLSESGAWTTGPSGWSDNKKVSGYAQPVNLDSDSGSYYNSAGLGSNQYAKITVTISGNGSAGGITRMQGTASGSTDCYCAPFDEAFQTYTIYRVDDSAGTLTWNTLGAQVSHNPSNGDYTLISENYAHRGLNGTTILAQRIDSTYTGGGPGFNMYNYDSLTDSQIDYWEADTYVSPGTVDVRAVGAFTAVSGTSRTPVLPTHATNDILLMFALSRGSSATLSCSTTGWAGLTQVNNGTGVRTRIFWKRAASSSETNPTVTSSVTEHLSAYCVSIKGAITSGDPWDATEVTNAPSASSTMTANAITVATLNSLLLRVFFSGDDNNHGSNSEGILRAGGTAYHSTAGLDGAQSLSSKADMATGSSGTATMTQGSNGPDLYVSYSILIKPASTGNEYNESLTFSASGTIAEAQIATLLGSVSLGASGSISPSNVATLLGALTLNANPAIGDLGALEMNVAASLSAGASIGEAGGVNFDNTLNLSASAAIAQAALKIQEGIVSLSAGASLSAATTQIAQALVTLTAIANLTPAQIGILLAQISLGAGAAMAQAEEVIPPAGIYNEYTTLSANATVTANVQAILNVLINLTSVANQSPAAVQASNAAIALAAQAGYSPSALGIFNHICNLAAAAGMANEGSLFTGVFLTLLKDLVSVTAAKAGIITNPKSDLETGPENGLITPGPEENDTNYPKDLLTPYE